MRGVDERLDWFVAHKPAAGHCAEHVMHALDVPRQGLEDATAVARVVQRAGHMQTGPCPRGAIRYWDRGSEGHGHVGIEHARLDAPAVVASVDVNGPATVGTRPLGWFAEHWPALRYLGWSWWWGGINTQPKETVVTTPTFKVGSAYKTPLESPITVAGGPKPYRVAITDLPAGGLYLLSLQVRMPKKTIAPAELEMVRLGWPGLAKEDGTGHNPIPSATQISGEWHRWRTTNHAIKGGGRVAFDIYMPPGAHPMRFVAKAERIV